MLPFSLIKCLLLFKHLLMLWGHKIIEWIPSYKERRSCVPHLPLPQAQCATGHFFLLLIFLFIRFHSSPSSPESFPLSIRHKPIEVGVSSGHIVGSLHSCLHSPSLEWGRHYHYALWSLIARGQVCYLQNQLPQFTVCVLPHKTSPWISVGNNSALGKGAGCGWEKCMCPSSLWLLLFFSFVIKLLRVGLCPKVGKYSILRKYSLQL